MTYGIKRVQQDDSLGVPPLTYPAEIGPHPFTPRGRADLFN